MRTSARSDTGPSAWPDTLRLAVLAEWCKARLAPLALQTLVIAAVLPVIIASGLGRAAAGQGAAGKADVAAGLSSAEAAAFGWHQIGLVLLIAVAASSVTQEYAHRLAPMTLLAIPSPWAVLAGKWVVHGAVAAVLSAVVLPVAVAAARVAATGRLSAAPSAVGDAGAGLFLLGPVLAFLLTGLAVGLAAVVRSTAVVVVALPAWFWLAEPLVASVPGVGASLGRFLPLSNAWDVLGVGDLPDPGWPPAIALLLVTAVAGLAFLTGTRVLSRRPAYRD